MKNESVFEIAVKEEEQKKTKAIYEAIELYKQEMKELYGGKKRKKQLKNRFASKIKETL